MGTNAAKQRTKGATGRTAPATPDRGTIIGALRAAFEGPAWHGPSVRTALRGISADQAAMVPAPGRNTVWEIVLHLAYARHRLLHRLRQLHDFPLPSFPRKLNRSWFPELPDPLDEQRWSEDQAILAAYQTRLIETLEAVPAKVLLRCRGSSERTIGEELLGLALHDAYHAGQIRLLDRMDLPRSAVDA